MTRLIALGGVLCISFTAILVRLADVSPATATVFRAAYAMPLLGLLWLAVRRRDHRPWRARVLAFASGLLLAVDLTAFHHTIDLIGAGLGTVLANTQVVFVGLIAWALLGERPTGLALRTVPVVFAGVLLISGLGSQDAYGSNPAAGAFFGLITGAAYAAFLLIFRASNRNHLAPTAGPLLDATAGTVLGGLVLGSAVGDLSLAITWPEHGWLVVLAVVAQVAGWLLISVALPRLPALDTSVMLLVQPVGAVIWALIIFDESLSAVQWAGAVLVVAGVLVATVRGMVRPEPTTEEAIGGVTTRPASG